MTLNKENFTNRLRSFSATFFPVVEFDPSVNKLLRTDFTEDNLELDKVDIENTREFTLYMNDLLATKKATFGIGGYDELRTIYSRSKLFNKDLGAEQKAEEPRRLHLGFDIWGPAGTPVYAPLDGTIHSFAFNDRFGDYGATIILQHQIEELEFHTLYGHLSLKDLEGLQKGDLIEKGKKFAHFGIEKENGYWPPHLHFQLIRDMENFEGDYPAVCKFSEREIYLQNCPDPDIILNMRKYWQ